MVAALTSWMSGCANQGAPPGGPEDRRPPVVVRTEPEAFEVVGDLRREIRFYFDERISEQVAGGTLEDAVTVSPLGGEVRVSHGSRTLDVEVEGGLRSGVVYRVTLLPVIRDLFGNQLRDPFELVFSTGAEPTPTALAGEVWDRISGQGMQGALVHAVGPDSLVHVARADDQGIFAFRYIPVGTFVVTGFEDANRDGEVGAREVKGSLSATVAAGDTLLLDLPVLPPDTTPAVLARASALDSVTLVLELDDYLDPAVDATDVDVELSREAGATPGASRLFHEHEYAAYVTRVRDSLSTAGGGSDEPPAAPPDTTTPVPGTATGAAGTPGTPDTSATLAAPADTTGVPRRTGAPVAGGRRGGAPPAAPRVGPPPLPGVRGSGGTGRGQATPVPPGRVLPGRRLVAVLEAPLEVGVEYQVRVSSVVNLNGLAGGGGEATLVLEARPPPDSTAVPDSLGVPSAVTPDTGIAPGGDAGE